MSQGAAAADAANPPVTGKLPGLPAPPGTPPAVDLARQGGLESAEVIVVAVFWLLDASRWNCWIWMQNLPVNTY